MRQNYHHNFPFGDRQLKETHDTFSLGRFKYLQSHNANGGLGNSFVDRIICRRLRASSRLLPVAISEENVYRVLPELCT